MTGPGQPQTCSHPINAQTLTGGQIIKQAIGVGLDIRTKAWDNLISGMRFYLRGY